MDRGRKQARILLRNFLTVFYNGIEMSYHLLMFEVSFQPVFKKEQNIDLTFIIRTLKKKKVPAQTLTCH